MSAVVGADCGLGCRLLTCKGCLCLCFVADGGWFDCFVGVFDSVALILIEFGFAVMMCLVMGWLFVCCVSGLSLCCCWLNGWCLMVVYVGFWLCLFYGSWGCGLYVGTLGLVVCCYLRVLRLCF